MRTLPNMSLVMWDQPGDAYDHSQLASDFAKIDAHDHTPGRGVLLTTQSFDLGSVTGPILAANSVTSAKIEDGTIVGADLGLGTVRQETGTAVSFLSWGVISESQSILAGSGDYVVEKVESGVVKIKWTTEKASASYAVIATSGQEQVLAVVGSGGINKKSFLVQLYKGAVLTNCQFSFVVVAAS